MKAHLATQNRKWLSSSTHLIRQLTYRTIRATSCRTLSRMVPREEAHQWMPSTLARTMATSLQSPNRNSIIWDPWHVTHRTISSVQGTRRCPWTKTQDWTKWIRPHIMRRILVSANCATKAMAPNSPSTKEYTELLTQVPVCPAKRT